jgi:RNA polymerase sigma-70 factor (ECF subfamily)
MTTEKQPEPEEWVDRYGDRLYRYALLRVRRPDLAADLVQETFAEAWRARASYAGESFFTRRGLWRAYPARWPADPADALEREEFWAAVRACLAGLPDTLADAFLLRELDETDSDEICQLLAITPTNLWARLHRARLQMRACLERRWFGKGE